MLLRRLFVAGGAAASCRFSSFSFAMDADTAERKKQARPSLDHKLGMLASAKQFGWPRLGQWCKNNQSSHVDCCGEVSVKKLEGWKKMEEKLP